jgi:hypothetical protein
MVKRAVIDRTYSKGINPVGAVYDRAFIISQHPQVRRGGSQAQFVPSHLALDAMNLDVVRVSCRVERAAAGDDDLLARLKIPSF